MINYLKVHEDLEFTLPYKEKIDKKSSSIYGIPCYMYITEIENEKGVVEEYVTREVPLFTIVWEQSGEENVVVSMTYGPAIEHINTTKTFIAENGVLYKPGQSMYPHYSWLKEKCGIDPLSLCRHFDYSIGSALKYLVRKGKVIGDKTEKEERIEDLMKAIFYINDEIRLLKNER